VSHVETSFVPTLSTTTLVTHVVPSQQVVALLAQSEPTPAHGIEGGGGVDVSPGGGEGEGGGGEGGSTIGGGAGGCGTRPLRIRKGAGGGLGCGGGLGVRVTASLSPEKVRPARSPTLPCGHSANASHPRKPSSSSGMMR